MLVAAGLIVAAALSVAATAAIEFGAKLAALEAKLTVSSSAVALS